MNEQSNTTGETKVEVKVDRFGNALPFKALAKEAEVPNSIPDASYKLTHPENAELTFTLDYMYVQRGENKGMKYPGKCINKDNLNAFIEFFGADYVASRIETVFN